MPRTAGSKHTLQHAPVSRTTRKLPDLLTQIISLPVLGTVCSVQTHFKEATLQQECLKNIIFPSVIPIVYVVGLSSWIICLSLLLVDVKSYSVSSPLRAGSNALTLQHPVAEPAGPLCL